MKKSNSDYIEISQSGLFSANWYLDQYRDVATAGQDPLEHYLLYGVSEGRDPGPAFSTSGYLSRYHDVANAGVNPLLHYIRYGKNEGRLAQPHLDPKAIKRSYRNFTEYLIHSMLDPLVKAPFGLVDLDSFNFMDQTAHWLCSKRKTCDEQPLVSVIMPMRDRANVIGDAVRSVLAQSYVNFELIVIDDGSQDNSVLEVGNFADTRVRLQINNMATGVSAARNRGLRMARGEFIAYLDSDNTWRPDYLSAMVGAFLLRSDADAVYSGQYLYRGCDDEPFAVRFGSYNQSLLRNHNYIDLNCFIHRRDILRTIGGGFCEKIKRWVDWELILRIAQVGKIYSIPILQSNYFLEKTENTITLTEELEPARHYIMNKVGSDCQSLPLGCEVQLIKKVTVLIVAHSDQQKLGECIEALEKQAHTPPVQVLVVANTSNHASESGLQDQEKAKINTIVSNSACGLLHAIDQAAHLADRDSDLLLLHPDAQLMQNTLPALQKAAYACDSIAIAVPQIILAKGDPTINTHVPYAFNDVDCDVTLSQHHNNIETLALFHGGGPIDLNFASLFCVYIKRDAWDVCGGFQTQQCKDYQPDRILCDFVRHILEKRIVYTPEAIVRNRKSHEN